MKKQNKKKRPEVVVAYLIFNKKGEVLLNKSTKWKDFYVLGGGHVEYGETLMDAVKREAKEEVGLKVKPLYCVNVGESINPAAFNRKIHMIFFHFVCRALSTKIKFDKKDIFDGIWIKPVEALKLKIRIHAKESIKNYLNKKYFDISKKV
jgi:nucleoside triphosphatase